jgi:hypothetical protein
MELDLLFLNADKKSSTKSLILKSLINNNSLTNIRIQSILRKEFNRKISYQAIRQALLELTKDSILEKKDKEYFISSEWLGKVKYEIGLIEKSIDKRNEIKSVNKDTTELKLKNLYEIGHFILYSLEQKYFDISKNKETYMQLDHLWIPFADQEKRKRLKQLMSNKDIKVLIKNKSALDIILSKWYKKFVKIKLGFSKISPCDYIIHNNTIIQIYLNQKLKSKMDRLYSLKSLAKLNIFNELSDMTYEESEIHIIILRNKDVVNAYKKEFENVWKRDKK